MNKAADYLIECGNPASFDKTVNSLGAMLQQDSNGNYVTDADGYYRMRVLGDPGFLEFAISNQGYGKIIKRLETI